MLQKDETDIDVMLEQRRQRQREVKRRSRAKQKRDIEMLRNKVQWLEVQYAQMALDDTNAQEQPSIQLMQRYTYARMQMTNLRTKMYRLKQSIDIYERFEAMLLAYANSYPTRLSVAADRESQLKDGNNNDDSPIEVNSFQLLTNEESHAVIRSCYLHIFHSPARGQRISSGMHLFGWSEERYVDGDDVHFSLSKFYSGVSAKELLESAWKFGTTFKYMRIIQPSTVSVRVVQVISGDAVVIERQLHHPYYPNSVVTVRFLTFRFRTENGYCLVYRTLHINEPVMTQRSIHGSSEQTRNRQQLVDVLLWHSFEEQGASASASDKERSV